MSGSGGYRACKGDEARHVEDCQVLYTHNLATFSRKAVKGGLGADYDTFRKGKNAKIAKLWEWQPSWQPQT